MKCKRNHIIMMLAASFVVKIQWSPPVARLYVWRWIAMEKTHTAVVRRKCHWPGWVAHLATCDWLSYTPMVSYEARQQDAALNKLATGISLPACQESERSKEQVLEQAQTKMPLANFPNYYSTKMRPNRMPKKYGCWNSKHPAHPIPPTPLLLWWKDKNGGWCHLVAVAPLKVRVAKAQHTRPLAGEAIIRTLPWW